MTREFVIIVYVLVCNLICTGILYYWLSKLDRRTRPLLSYEEYDELIQKFRDARLENERAWRKARGLPDVPGMVEAMRSYNVPEPRDPKEFAPPPPPPPPPKPSVSVHDDPLQALARIMEPKEPFRG